MLVLADYTFWDALWTMFVFFLWIIWFWILIKVFIDVFRRSDIGGLHKTLWLIFVIVLPFLGVFIYLIAQGHKMTERDIAHAKAAQSQFDSYVQSVAGSSGGGGAAAEIERAKGLLDTGAISQQEFDAIKAKALA